jgi:hypothetical protein
VHQRITQADKHVTEANLVGDSLLSSLANSLRFSHFGSQDKIHGNADVAGRRARSVSCPGSRFRNDDKLLNKVIDMKLHAVQHGFNELLKYSERVTLAYRHPRHRRCSERMPTRQY